MFPMLGKKKIACCYEDVQDTCLSCMPFSVFGAYLKGGLFSHACFRILSPTLTNITGNSFHTKAEMGALASQVSPILCYWPFPDGPISSGWIQMMRGQNSSVPHEINIYVS